MVYIECHPCLNISILEIFTYIWYNGIVSVEKDKNIQNRVEGGFST
jgi:hypothetical protein